jgi:hypothetical protein
LIQCYSVIVGFYFLATSTVPTRHARGGGTQGKHATVDSRGTRAVAAPKARLHVRWFFSLYVSDDGGLP